MLLDLPCSTDSQDKNADLTPFSDAGEAGAAAVGAWDQWERYHGLDSGPLLLSGRCLRRVDDMALVSCSDSSIASEQKDNIWSS